MNCDSKIHILSIGTSMCMLFFTLNSLLGQSTNVEPPEILRAEFSVYSLKRLKDLHFLHGDHEQSTALTFYSSARSPQYHYEGPNPIRFFKASKAADDPLGSRSYRQKVGEVTLPTQADEILLIFFPTTDSEDNEHYTIFPLEDSIQTHPWGSIRFFNTTAYPLELSLGKEKIRLPPGPSQSYHLRNKRTSLTLGFYYEGTFHLSYEDSITLSGSARGLMMIFPPFVKGSPLLQTRFIREYNRTE